MDTNIKDNMNVKDRIKVSTDIAVLKTQVDLILNNHLPTITKRLNWVFALVVIGILVPILMYIIDK